MNDDLHAELLAMQAEDQDHRWRALDAPPADAAAEWSAVREVDHRNTARMREIIARHGWPGRSLVGEDGANAAWLLVQHADDDLAFQRECLALLAGAVDVGEASAVEHAYLTDRVAVAEGRLQTYGTQFRRDGEVSVPAPIEDPDSVDQRRTALGLPTLEEYTESIKAMGHRRGSVERPATARPARPHPNRNHRTGGRRAVGVARPPRPAGSG